ncbi:T9SS type A sorting domain-containing protein [Rufibacter tibetensis]|uniref:Secretion system C-terminal sorting domain-containing protein n=1 Tax=Rufibacter tibetensis TaxID=512763 RepID=A0A0P0CFH6_9BACT|nr:T9SS type A sorting domain-containing protein [Rufibacter tibetensis]ALJ00644.1 hypothetical protein DC20_18760 [Rufibacter tibetensis]
MVTSISGLESLCDFVPEILKSIPTLNQIKIMVNSYNCSVATENFQNFWRYVLTVMTFFLFAGNVFAQTVSHPRCTKPNGDLDPPHCVSQDLQVTKAFLTADQCSCTSGQVTADLNFNLFNKTGSTRTSFAVFAILVKTNPDGSTQEVYFKDCVSPVPPGETSTITFNDAITYTCGQTLTLTDVYLAWTDASTGDNRQCTELKDNFCNIDPKCGRPADIVIIPLLSANATAGTINCHGGTTTLNAVASGGVGPYQYSIDGVNYQSSPNFTVEEGSYSVYVKDSQSPNPCVATGGPVIISEPAELVAGRSAGTISCHGETTTLTGSASGGTGAYQYSLNGTTWQSSSNFTVTAGTYTVQVKDANNCIDAADPITIGQPDALVAGRSAGTIACRGGTTTLTGSATGGTGAYQYSINGTTWQNDPNFTVAAGTYTIHVKDANNCIDAADPITISQPDALVANGVVGAPITCHGGTTTLTASATGGTAPYRFKLNDGEYQSSPSFTVGAGTYTIHVIDANNCTDASDPIPITAPDVVVAGRSAGTIACFGGTTTLTGSASGGTGPYQYSINGTDWQPDPNFTVSAGTYTIQVKDANNCRDAADPITIGQPAELVAGGRAGTISCFGGSTTLTASAMGGTGPYQYSLDGVNWQSSATFTVNAARSPYTVHVKDANDCRDTFGPIAVTQPNSSLQLGPCSKTDVTCDGPNTGSVTAGTVTNAVGNVSYSWINSAGMVVGNSPTVSNLPAGTYTLTVRDDCFTRTCTVIINPATNCIPLQGCTPGYWKNHPEAWGCGYAPFNNFLTTFGISNRRGLNQSLTLAGALDLGGGNYNALARASTAALLNACHPVVNYPYSTDDILRAVREMFMNGTTTLNGVTYTSAEALKNELDRANNLGCPLNNQNAVIRSTSSSSVVASGKTSAVGQGIELSAYPNPYTESATINFTLREAGAYTLEIHDMNGRVVKKVSVGKAEAGRSYSFNLDGSLPSGIYIARLKTGKTTKVIRLMHRK